MIKSTSRLGAAVAAALALVLGHAMPASATTTAVTINTYDDWDGVTFVSEWGHPNTATYGQVITVPAGKKKITSFTFWMACTTSGTVTYRAEVYGWDGSKATTEAYESKAKTLKLDCFDPDTHPVKTRLRKAKVTAGSQYVIFLSISKDYEVTDPGASTKWAATASDVYPGGGAVYLNDGGDESQWTTATWGVVFASDFAMKAQLK